MSIQVGEESAVRRIWPAGIELWAPVAAVLLTGPVAAMLLLPNAGGLSRVSPVSLFISVFLGPLLVLVGTWLDVRRNEPLGLLFAGLGVLLGLNGAVATSFLGLIPFLPDLLAFVAGIVRHHRAGAGASAR